jgi:hypothetical protein
VKRRWVKRRWVERRVAGARHARVAATRCAWSYCAPIFLISAGSTCPPQERLEEKAVVYNQARATAAAAQRERLRAEAEERAASEAASLSEAARVPVPWWLAVNPGPAALTDAWHTIVRTAGWLAGVAKRGVRVPCIIGCPGRRCGEAVCGAAERAGGERARW